MFRKFHILLVSLYIPSKSNFRNVTKSYFKFSACNESNVMFEKKLSKRLKQNGFHYICEAEVASSIASHLCESWQNGFILEANPGPGLLTKAILNEGVSQLRVFEKNPEFLPLLKELSAEYSNLNVMEEDIIMLPTFETRLSESNLYDNFFEDIPEIPWEEQIPCRFFSVIYSKRSKKFIRYLLAAMPTKSSIFSLGRCEFYFLLPESEYLYINAVPKENFTTYRWTTVLFNLFFEIKCLQKYASSSLFPAPVRNKKLKVAKEQTFYFMKLTPKSDLFSFMVKDNKLPEFYFFIRHHLIKRTGLVIPTLEGWIPSCGVRLIKDGMTVFTKFGDLSPKQLLLLFNQFSSWPEYEDSSFCAAVQRFYSKGTLPYDEEELA